MTTFTNPHNLPLIEPETDYIKDGNEVSALAGDINALAMATASAISAEGERSESAAKWYKGGASGTDINALETGLYHISSGGVASDLGLPVNFPGHLWNMPFGTLGTRIFITSEEVPRTFGQRKTSSGWQTWNDMTNPWFLGGAATTAPKLNSLDALPTGAVSISSVGVARDLGLPLEEPSIVATYRYGSANYVYQEQVTLTSPSSVRTRRKLSTAFSEWTDPIGSRIPPASGGASTPGSGMKLIPLALTLGQGTQSAPDTRQYRIPFQFNAPINRWRLHITDRNPHTGEHVGTGINIANVYLGNHATNGSFTGTPTRIGGGIPLVAYPVH